MSSGYMDSKMQEIYSQEMPVCRGCESPKIENYDTMLCANCGFHARKAERKALEPPKKKKAIKPRSEKRKAQEKEYGPKKAKQLEDHPYCQAKLIGCTGMALECHHAEGRIGDNYLKESSFISVCPACHFRIHNVLSAAEARKLGLKK